MRKTISKAIWDSLKLMNRLQRISAGLFFSTIVALIAMHNPLSGYVTEGATYKVDLPLAPCTDQDKKMYREFLTNTYTNPATRDKLIISNGDPNQIENTVARQVGACHLLAPGISTDSSTSADFRKQPLEFTAWQSVDPSIGWLGGIVNLFGALLAVVLVGICFIFFIFSNDRY